MSFTGRLLVAPPGRASDFWERSVVLIYEESKLGSVGLVLNKDSGRTVQELAEYHDASYRGKEGIYAGGEMSPSALILMHTPEWRCTNTMSVAHGVSISSDNYMVNRICKGDKPEKWKFYLGMSIWKPGDLEKEVSGRFPYSKRNSWLVANAGADIIFEKNPEKMWKMAIDRAVSEATELFFSA